MAVEMLIVVWLAVCALCDARTGEVLNALTLPPLVLGALATIREGWGAVAIFCAAFSILGGVYALSGMGGADMKILIALVGLWPESLTVILVGVVLWAAGRMLLGQRGSFRAVVPMALAAGVVWFCSFVNHL